MRGHAAAQNSWIPRLQGCCFLALSLWLTGECRGAVPVARFLTASTTEDKVTGDGPLSLREAILLADVGNNPTTILVPAGTYSLSLTNSFQDTPGSGALPVTSPALTVLGQGMGSTVLQYQPGNRGDNGRIIHVFPQASLDLRGVTLAIGAVYGPGGAIFSEALSVDRCAILNSAAYGNQGSGGAVYSSGKLSMEACLMEGNQGFSVDCAGTAAVRDTTFSGNEEDTRPWFWSTQVTGVTVAGSRVRIFGEMSSIYFRQQAFVVDLDLAPGATDQFRFEAWDPNTVPNINLFGPWRFSASDFRIGR